MLRAVEQRRLGHDWPIVAAGVAAVARLVPAASQHFGDAVRDGLSLERPVCLTVHAARFTPATVRAMRPGDIRVSDGRIGLYRRCRMLAFNPAWEMGVPVFGWRLGDDLERDDLEQDE